MNSHFTLVGPGKARGSRPFREVRRTVTKALRAWFDTQGFVEVETGVLQVSPGNETHLHALSTTLTMPGGDRVTRHLRTSPQFACKKLLAAGEKKIVEFARAFSGSVTRRAASAESTMLERDRAGRLRHQRRRRHGRTPPTPSSSLRRAT